MAIRGLVNTVDHPHGPLRQLSSIYHFSGTPVQDTRPSPLLGQHMEAVLRDLCGLDSERIAALREAGVIA